MIIVGNEFLGLDTETVFIHSSRSICQKAIQHLSNRSHEEVADKNAGTPFQVVAVPKAA